MEEVCLYMRELVDPFFSFSLCRRLMVFLDFNWAEQMHGHPGSCLCSIGLRDSLWLQYDARLR